MTMAGTVLSAAERIELLEMENELHAKRRDGLERAIREYAQAHLAIANALGLDGVKLSSRELLDAVRAAVQERDELRAAHGQAVA
jgi:hypothetical protein